MLVIVTPLDSFCYDWEESEILAGRRLVRFSRLQDGNKLIVSAERVSQCDYDAKDIVISCIYREETNSYYATSVDIIYLLQRLVEADFELDERNRIRRNLESLRPTTVSKTKPGFESFFQQIMDFPEPRPRRIEKDIKVFDWKLLPDALEKIILKYTLFHTLPAAPIKEEAHSPPFPAVFRKELPIQSSLDNNPYGANPCQLSGYPDSSSRSDALGPRHWSSLAHLGPSPPQPRPDSLLKNHPYPTPELLHSINVYSEIQHPDTMYGMPGRSLDLQTSPLAPLPDNISGDWSAHTNNPALLSLLDSTTYAQCGYTHSDMQYSSRPL